MFQINDAVFWTSTSNGISRGKLGYIVDILNMTTYRDSYDRYDAIVKAVRNIRQKNKKSIRLMFELYDQVYKDVVYLIKVDKGEKSYLYTPKLNNLRKIGSVLK